MGLIACFIGKVPLYLYGSIVAAALAAGLVVARISAWVYDEAFSPVVDLLLWGIPVSFVIARIGYVLGHWGFYADHLESILCFWEGGFSIYGAAIGFLTVLWVYCRREGESFWHWLDVLAPALLLILAVNQLGHFVTQTTVGMPLPPDLPNDHTLAEYIEFSYRPSGFENYEYFRPVALYQAGLQFAVLLLVSALTFLQARRRLWAEGCVFLCGALLIALIRFVCGFFYLSATPGLHSGQLLSLLVAAVCLIVFWRRQHCRHDRYFWR